MQIFKNFDLVHENGSNSVIFGPIHLISFAYGHWQAVLGTGWGKLEWSPWFVVKFWGRSKKFKILRFGNLLPTRLCRAATTKPRQIERSSFFLLDHKGKTRIYRLVSGSCDVRLRRKRDSPMEEDDCPPIPPWKEKPGVCGIALFLTLPDACFLCNGTSNEPETSL